MKYTYLAGIDPTRKRPCGMKIIFKPIGQILINSMYPDELFDFVRAGMVPNSIGIQLLDNGGYISKYCSMHQSYK